MSSVRKPWSLGLAAAAAVGLAACFPSPIEAPPCLEVPFTPVSQSGDTITTASGLRLIELGGTPSGPEVASCSVVAIHFISSLSDGTVFLNTYELDPPQPIAFTPGQRQVIDGLAEGMIGMQAGGRRLLIIPPNLAFGAQGRSENGVVIVPPNETVTYEVELVEMIP